MIILCCFVPIIQTLYYIVCLSIICPDSIGVFLIIAFVYFDIVERVTYSEIVSIYSNPNKAAPLETDFLHALKVLCAIWLFVLKV